MTNEECNKIIAEFMGWEYIDWDKNPLEHISGSSLFDVENQIMYRGKHFTSSLDALVPVVRRYCEIKYNTKNEFYVSMFFDDMFSSSTGVLYMSGGELIEVFASEVAKAILELKEVK